MKKILSFIMAVMLTATTYGFVGINENFGASTVYAAEAFNSDDFEIKKDDRINIIDLIKLVSLFLDE